LTSGSRLTWLGHSTVVLELDGTRFVTDPVLGRRVAHLWRAQRAPNLEGSVEVVLLSHLHWDHLHARSLRRLAPGALAVVPRGSERLVRRLGFARVEPVGPGDVVPVGEVEVEATHAEHPASRRMGARAGAVGYLIRASRRVYFAGDTDLFDGMSSLAEGLDVALLPVAGWGRSVSNGHLDARRAAEALELLQPRIAVPIHWGTYAPFGLARLGGSDSAAEDFKEEAARRVPETEVHILRVGSRLEL
jgi:L-ascorbate metabolism protein UlaG (beta-lactamase superfamily)